jgi:molybdenum-dependent DNA-binding transcriptional regulator ModE
MARRRRRAHEAFVTCRVCRRRLRIITWTHLRKHNLTPAEYKEIYGVDYLWSDERRDTMSRNRTSKKGSTYEPRSREKILRDIRKLAGRRKSLNFAELDRLDAPLQRQARRVFGSLDEAIRAAGLEPEHLWQSRSLAELKRDAKSWVREHGPISGGVLSRTDRSLYKALRKQFGSVRNAAKELGLRYGRRQREWNRARVKNEIRKRSKNGESLAPSAVVKKASALYRAACRHYGGWGSAVRAAGLKYRHDAVTWPLNKLASVTKAWSQTHGPLRWQRMKDTDSALLAALRKCFGSLEKAARKFKLPYGRDKKRWTKKEVLKAIRRLALLRKTPGARWAMQHEAALYSAACRRFGSWRAAVKKASRR